MSDDWELRRRFCEECGEELWGPSERFGLCSGCQRAEAEERDAADVYDEVDYELTRPAPPERTP